MTAQLVFSHTGGKEFCRKERKDLGKLSSPQGSESEAYGGECVEHVGTLCSIHLSKGKVLCWEGRVRAQNSQVESFFQKCREQLPDDFL